MKNVPHLAISDFIVHLRRFVLHAMIWTIVFPSPNFHGMQSAGLYGGDA